jgi:hypothetical protein
MRCAPAGGAVPCACSACNWGKTAHVSSQANYISRQWGYSGSGESPSLVGCLPAMQQARPGTDRVVQRLAL